MIWFLLLHWRSTVQWKYWPFPDISTNNNTVQKQTLPNCGAVGSLICQYKIDILMCLCLCTGTVERNQMVSTFRRNWTAWNFIIILGTTLVCTSTKKGWSGTNTVLSIIIITIVVQQFSSGLVETGGQRFRKNKIMFHQMTLRVSFTFMQLICRWITHQIH